MAYSLTTDHADTWQGNSSLAETNIYILEHGILSDVTVLAGESGEEIRAHKFMLASRSPVLYAMFRGPLAETNEAIQVHVYWRLRHYGRQCYVLVLYAAKKYEITGLIRNCINMLGDQRDIENVCEILQQALRFDEKKLVADCLSLIFDRTDDVLRSTGFLSLDKDVLKVILESEDLNSEEEEDIYKAYVDWARHKCNEQGQSAEVVLIKLPESEHEIVFKYLTSQILNFKNMIGQI